ncbi:MAG: CinA family nicotinamide mononucleotide deamidase-related protein [Desulfobacteraceae bacterium]|jgi:nicotinamide-nucleotide amidase
MNPYPSTPSCEILTIGTELLLGRVNDTNSAYLARVLGRIGVRVRFRTAVGDQKRDMKESLGQALERCDMVITTGGLGPTRDDLTRETVAELAGQELTFRQDLMDDIRALFERRGYHMSENNRRQAWIPEGSEAVPNPVGTAPGFVAEVRGKPVICLPGVPRELEYLMEHRMLDWIRERFLLGRNRIVQRVLRVVGMGESKVDRVVGDLMGEGRNPEVALLASEGEIQVVITSYGGDGAGAEERIQPLEKEVRARLGDKVFGRDEDTLEGVVDRFLSEQGRSLVVLETFTSGLAAGRLHDLRSTRLLRSYVLPFESSIEQWLGNRLPADAVESTEALAREAMERSRADTALVVFGFPKKDEQGASLLGTALATGEGMALHYTWKAGWDLPMLRRTGAVIGLNTLRLALLNA